MKLLIKGGRIINPALDMDMTGDILIIDGSIAQIGRNIDGAGAELFDAKGYIAAPGLVDMHVHLREPGMEAKEDIYSGTRSAAAGGFTTIACMPNTKPVVDSSLTVSGIIQRAQNEGAVRVKVIGALSKGQEGRELAEIGDMVAAGAVALSDDGHYVSSARLFQAGLLYANMFDKVVISHAEEDSLVEDGHMHEGAVSAMLGMRSRPAVAEDIAVMRDILLAEYTGARLHIAHVSSANAVEIIRQAKKRGVKVTAEVTPHHLALTDEAVIGFDTATKVNPPLRSADHVRALIQGLKDGTIDAIATDHAPHAAEEKDMEYIYAPSGFAGLETSVGVILTSLYHTGQFTLPQILEKMTIGPARILGVEAGVLQPGGAADITLIDPDREWVVDETAFYTKGKKTPFAGKTLKGKAVAAFVAGELIMKNGEVLK